MRNIIIVHCGAGSKPDANWIAEKAGKAGLEILSNGGEAIGAVESAITVMEDEEYCNAGTGSKMRLDGSIQMDAGIMDSVGRCGAVAAVTDVKYPIMVARKVADTPHMMLAGESATRFARKMGFEPYDPSTEKAVRQLEEVRKRMREDNMPKYAQDWKELEKFGLDTVGAVAIDSKGVFAAGSSTGGMSYMLPGRVGDSPIIGCGFFAGERGAVTVSGIGEYIMKHVLSKWVYDRIEEGKSADKAAQLGVGLFDDYVPTGILAISAVDTGISCNTKMAYWQNEPE
jgi:L-asparaginase/beta-aspartyl-peptidase (threonine type)